MHSKIILALTTAFVCSYGGQAFSKDSYTVVLKSSEQPDLIAEDQQKQISLSCNDNYRVAINTVTCLSENNNTPNAGYCSLIKFDVSEDALYYVLKDPTYPTGRRFGISYVCATPS